MASELRVRYLRCVGPDVTANPRGASSVFVRLEHADGGWRFRGYVILNDEDEVIEKSELFGRYEEEDDWIERQNECRVVSRDEFAGAWRRPYSGRSLMRRFLSNLNGSRDDRDPSETDESPPS